MSQNYGINSYGKSFIKEDKKIKVSIGQEYRDSNTIKFLFVICRSLYITKYFDYETSQKLFLCEKRARNKRKQKKKEIASKEKRRKELIHKI